MMLTLEAIRQALALPNFDPLPFQLRLAPSPRPLRRPADRAGHVRLGAVLALLYPWEGAAHLLLVKRPGSLRTHSGQVSFPGGSKEEGESFATAALRETEEEVGIPPSQIELLGELAQVYIPPSDFEVHPFVGWHNGRPHFRPSPTEVEEVLEVPLTFFAEAELHLATEGNFRYPYYQLGRHRLWGATAVMISELLARLDLQRRLAASA